MSCQQFKTNIVYFNNSLDRVVINVTEKSA